MKILTKILGVLSLIGGFFSAIFFVLFKQSKTEKDTIQDKYNAMQKENENAAKCNEALIQSKKTYGDKLNENKEELQKALGGNKFDNALACDSILSK